VPCGERKVVSVPFDQIDLDTCGFRAAARGGDHVCRGIHADDLCGVLCEPGGQHAVAAADIEDAQAVCRADRFQQDMLLERAGVPAERAPAPVRIGVGKTLERRLVSAPIRAGPLCFR
jgi:hypothetical protein